MINLRFASWKVLFQVLEKNQFSHLELQKLFKEEKELEARDRAFIERVVRGTLEHLYEINSWINHFSRVPVSKLKPAIRVNLQQSVYQILFMDSVPDRAVCNEAVKLAEKTGFRTLKGYVNGVLRTIGREHTNGFHPWKDISQGEKLLGLKYSMPEWIIKRFVTMFGYEKAETIFQCFEKPVRLAVYRNKNRITSEELKNNLTMAGADPEPLPYGLDGFYLNHGADLERLRDFQDGNFMIQDISSMIQGLITSAGQNQCVFDVCAAPGGKSIHAAIDMQGRGMVYSFDVSEYKTSMIRENAERMQIRNIRISVQDATVFNPELENKADILIADLPCSGLGIIGRKPEIRYNIREKDIQELAFLQKKILDTVWKYVKPGGRLVYSTCTLSMEEDEENFRYLTEKLPFDAESLEPYCTDDLICPTKSLGYMKLIPGDFSGDGFFIGSAIRRK